MRSAEDILKDLTKMKELTNPFPNKEQRERLAALIKEATAHLEKK